MGSGRRAGRDRARRVPAVGRRTVAALAAIAIAAVGLSPVAGGPGAGAAPGDPARSDIVVVMLDDATYQEIPNLPNIVALARTGTTFSNYYVSTPECCPSRATYLTGQYLHNHGVKSGLAPTGGYAKLDHTNTLPVWLQDAGYHTAHVGKYLNGIGEKDPLERPTGWDRYDGLVDPSTYNYWNYTINHDGVLEQHGTDPAEYQTDVLAQKAVDDILAAPEGEPLFLSFNPLAPHAGTVAGTGQRYAVPPPRYRNTFTGSQPPTPDMDEEDVSDKPAHVQALPRLTTTQRANLGKYWRQSIEALRAADDAVGRIVDALRSSGRLANTDIFITSDNGFFHGEHRITSAKIWPYEIDVHMPLVAVGPHFPVKNVSRLAVSADLAPTIVDLAQATATVRRSMDGASLRPMLTDPAYLASRSLLLETGQSLGRLYYQGVRGPRWKYIEYTNGERELYDLSQDPYELVNRHGDPELAPTEALLATRLAKLRTCAGPRCTTIL